jgi:apolipoprotein D and lipocalin family protein
MTQKNKAAPNTRFSGFLVSSILAMVILTGCQSIKPIYTVEAVDLKRFMGDWYVIASIPTSIEKTAFNAVESYRLNEDGTVGITFTFNKGSLEGPFKKYQYRGFIRDKASNAVWDYQIFWPFKSEGRVIYLAADYSQTVIGRSKRDHVWIMARTPSISDEDYRKILRFLTEQGYQLDNLRKVSHAQKGT